MQALPAWMAEAIDALAHTETRMDMDGEMAALMQWIRDRSEDD